MYKIGVVFISVVMILCSIGTPVFAESAPNLDENGVLTVVDSGRPATASENKTSYSDKIDELSAPPALDKKHLENASQLGSKARASSEVISVQGVITEPDGLEVYYPLELSSGMVMRFIMECPDDPSLDYDLQLYEEDPVTGGLSWVDGSTYETYFNTDRHGNTKTLDEALSYINRSGANKVFALAVTTKSGYSATKPYTLHMQIATEPSDNKEPNDSAFYAKDNAFEPGKPLQSQDLDAAMDQDWYRMGILNSYAVDYDYVKIYAPKASANGRLDLEIYQANGLKMVLVPPVESTNAYDKYELGLGYYYVRVFDHQFTAGNTPGSYEVKLDKGGYVDKVSLSFLVDHEPPIQTGYPQGENYWFVKTFTAVVTATDKWDNPVEGEPVSVTWKSRMWPQDPNREVTKSDWTDSQGRCLLKFTPLIEPGPYYHTITNGYISFTHRYAIDDLDISCGGLNFSSWIYHFFSSDPHM